MKAPADTRISARIKGWAERSRRGSDVTECFIQSKAEIAELRAALDAADALLVELLAKDDRMLKGESLSMGEVDHFVRRVRALLKGTA